MGKPTRSTKTAFANQTGRGLISRPNFPQLENTMETYMIVRKYFQGDDEVIDTDLTLDEAQEHCQDPETSSKTCMQDEGIQRTEEQGPWFDAYEEE